MFLPTEADVRNWHITQALDCKSALEKEYRDVHHFTDYRLYDPGHLSLADSNEREGGAHKNEIEAHPYLELPLKQLVKRIPELKGISPAPDQQGLAMILQKTGTRVDDFFANMVDIIALEDTSQQRLVTGTLPGGMPAGTRQATQHMQDSYLMLRRTDSTRPHIEEFRMDAIGNRMDGSGRDKGFVVTSGFALSSVHFASQFQWDSRFLYLGTQRIHDRDAYVVAFAQLPSEAHNAVTLRGQDGNSWRMLCQGIAWIDKASFQIVQFRTDLLAPRPEIGLDQQTTRIVYSEIRLADLATPLWLPRDVNVYIRFADFSEAEQPEILADLGSRLNDESFRNIHHYSNYRRYRVSTKIRGPK